MKQKKKLKAAALLTLWLLLMCLSFFGISPLVKQLQQNKQVKNAIIRTNAVLVDNLRCVQLPNEDAARALTDRLSEFEGFLGLYKFSDRELIQTIYYGENFSEYIYSNGSVDGRIGFFPYTYNEGLDKLGLLKLTAGEMFAFRPYAVGEEVPIVVTENEYFKLGDKVRLELNTSNSNITDFPDAEPLFADAVVCGIAEKNVYLPATDQNAVSDLQYFTRINERIQVFLPDLTAYTNAFDYQPVCNRGELTPYYVLFESGMPENIDTLFNEYGYSDIYKSTNTLGWEVEREVFDFDALHMPIAIGCICAADFIATVFIFKEIVMLYYKKRDGIL